MLKLKRWFWTKFFEFKYRRCDADVCCCGSSNCEGDYSHSYVNAKEYYIDRDVQIKLGLVI
jgi:hypothetical protein